MNRELAAALDALGPFAQEPGGVTLRDWDQRLSASFRT
jgi:hypothetical protein